MAEFENDVFISYKHDVADDLTAYIVQALEKAGLTVWLDDASLPYGPEFLKRIVRALESSRVVVPLISPAYLISNWCIGELFIGKAFNCLVPVLTDDVDLKNLPFNVDTDLGPRAAEITSSAEVLERFCSSVYRLVSTRQQRTGFDGSDLPVVTGGPVHVLDALRGWPYPPFTLNRVKQELTDSHALLSAVSNTEVRNGYALFSHPKYVREGLLQLQRALDETSGDEASWTALGHLAKPFLQPVSTYAFLMAKRPIEELEAEGILDVDTPKVRKVAAARKARRTRRLPRQWRQLVEQVRPVAQGPFEPPEDKATKARKRLAKQAAERRKLFSSLAELFAPFKWLKKKENIAGTHEAAARPIVATASALPIRKQEVAYVQASASDGLGIAVERHVPRIWKVIATGIAMLIVVSALYILVKPSDDDTSPGEPPALDPRAVGAAASLPEPSPSKPTLPDYCADQDHCVFRAEYSIWRVAGDCFGEDTSTRVRGVLSIWELNREKLRDPDPNRVWEGETFAMPVSHCPALAAPAGAQ